MLIVMKRNNTLSSDSQFFLFLSQLPLSTLSFLPYYQCNKHQLNDNNFTLKTKIIIQIKIRKKRWWFSGWSECCSQASSHRRATILPMCCPLLVTDLCVRTGSGSCWWAARTLWAGSCWSPLRCGCRLCPGTSRPAPRRCSPRTGVAGGWRGRMG